MKNIAIVVLVALLAVAGFVIAKEKAPDRPTPGSGTISIKALDPVAEKALRAERAAVVAVVEYDGSVQLLAPSESKYELAKLPLKANITSIEPVSIVTYEGSQCLVWVPERVVQNQTIAKFCAKWIP